MANFVRKNSNLTSKAKVGDIITVNSLSVKVTKGTRCNKCAFLHQNCSSNGIACENLERADLTNVHFVKQ